MQELILTINILRNLLTSNEQVKVRTFQLSGFLYR